MVLEWVDYSVLRVVVRLQFVEEMAKLQCFKGMVIL